MIQRVRRGIPAADDAAGAEDKADRIARIQTMALRDDEMIAHREGTARRALVRPPEHEHDHAHEEAA